MRFSLPFRVGIEPMERLLIATLDGDPEYEALEPQLFDDAVNGKGMRVLRYKKDGRVDVYWQPGVRVDRNTFTVGAGIREFQEAAIEPSRFQISEHSLDLDMGFADAQGRRIELRIHEEFDGRRGFPLLAPVGADIKEPKQLFLVFMPGIDLVRRAGSRIDARIGDRVARPAGLPVLLGGHRVWFIRYAGNPMIGVVNPPASRPLLFEAPGPGKFEVEGMTITVDGDRSVSRISCGYEPRIVEMGFLPGFPNMIGLPERTQAVGNWTIRLGGVEITGGAYRASRTGDAVAVSLDVTNRWKPSGLPLSMKILTSIVRKFRTWPTTYRWRGTVRDGEPPTMLGAWERVGKG